MFFKKLFLVLIFMVFVFIGNEAVFASGFYSLSKNDKEVQMTTGEIIQIKSFVNQFLIRVKNKQIQVIADTLLYIPEKNFQNRNLTLTETKQIKENFVKGINADLSDWTNAEFMEVRKFRMTGPAYAMPKNPIDSYKIFLKIKGKKEFFWATKDMKLSPLLIFSIKYKDKFLITTCNNFLIFESGNETKSGGARLIPVYPVSVDPMAD